jgi:hypothetical protein
MSGMGECGWYRGGVRCMRAVWVECGECDLTL